MFETHWEDETSPDMNSFHVHQSYQYKLEKPCVFFLFILFHQNKNPFAIVFSAKQHFPQ